MRRPAALVCSIGVLVAWMLVLVEPSDNDGASGILTMVGVPALCVAVLCIVAFTATAPTRAAEGGRRWMWWPLAVLPAGVLGALAVSVLRAPDYFIGDESPWMLLWMPFFVAIGLLLGPVVAAFWLGPVVLVCATIVRILRGQAKAISLVLPLAWLSVGALTLIGAASVDAEGVGRLAYPNLILAFFGLPGAYEVVWPPGLWIVRGIVLALVLVFTAPRWLRPRTATAG